MYEYIIGKVTEVTPTECIIEANSIGYKALISLQTYSQIKVDQIIKLYLHHHLREDSELFFGFFTKDERMIFNLLIEVNGVGPNTARMMLSSMNSDEVRNAIITGDINKLKSVKGVGLKTAQRILIDLKDKIVKSPAGEISVNLGFASSPLKEEAFSALTTLGFPKGNVEKILDAILIENPNLKLEDIIKQALKRL